MKISLELHLKLSKSNINKFTYNVSVIVLEELSGNLTIVLEASKCGLDLKTCEKQSSWNIKDMCPKFKEKNAFYTSIFESLSPPFGCPIQVGNYTSIESVFDLSSFAWVPLDGYIWVINVKLVETNRGKSRRTVACVNGEFKVMKTRKPE